MQRKVGRPRLPQEIVKTTQGFTLELSDNQVIDYVNDSHKLYSRSMALRHIIREYARANGIQTPSPTLTETP